MPSSADLMTPPQAVTVLLQQTMDLALGCHRAQQWEEAAHLYEAVLRLQPQHPDANHNLGAIAVEKGDYLRAIELFQAALQAQSDNTQYWFSLVEVLILAKEHSLASDILEDARRAGMAGDMVGQLVQCLVAETTTLQTLTRPRHQEPPAPLQAQLGRLYEQKKFAEVLTLGEKIAQQFPHSNKALRALVAARMQLGQTKQVEPYLQQILQNEPQDIDALSNYALLRAQRGELVQAEILLRQALHWAPKAVSVWVHLGQILRQQGSLAAIGAYTQALKIKRDDPKLLFNYGSLLVDLHRLAEAEQCFEKLTRMQPQNPEAHNALGIVYQQQGRIDAALIELRTAIKLAPKNIDIFASYLFTINCAPNLDAQERFSAYQEFNRRFAEPLHGYWQPHNNQRSSNRRLRVGYMASNFRNHSTRFFLEPLLANHHSERVELFAYAEFYEITDAVTDRYRQYFDHWCETRYLNDEQLVAKIRADQIDVLIDIPGHTKGNRLTALAHKPAPVSLHWLDSGYTTGLTAIDYYLTDAATIPTGTEHLFSETPWRLPRTGLVFRPPPDTSTVNALPASTNGYITFGTLSRAVRLNQELIATWAQLLHRIPNAKLVINSGNFSAPDVRQSWLERFEKLGISADRLDIGYQTPAWNVLQRIDITLDCFPQNSGTTLFESLYMGLPFITLSGTPSMGTLGAAIVTALGRPEWIAHSKDEYLEKLVALASNIPALATLRAGLRQEMQASALMDEVGFARDVEDAYFAMFQRWADTHPESGAS